MRSAVATALGILALAPALAFAQPIRPDDRLTPGAVAIDATVTEVCARGYARSHRNVPPEERIAVQCQAAEVFECDYFLYGCGDATGDQDLAVLRLSTEPSGQVAHGADSGIAGALGKADLAKRRIALGDAGLTECPTQPLPPQ